MRTELHEQAPTPDASRERIIVHTRATGRGDRESHSTVRWRVAEMENAPYADRPACQCLMFMSDAAMRRVQDFPADWRTLSDEALLAISWRR